MLIDFNKAKEITVPGMNNGTGTMTAKMYMDEQGKMNLIAEYADHIVYLNDGSVLLDGSPEDVLSSEILYEKNLDMPYVAVLGFQARSRGLFIDKIPTTVDEALKIFTECVQKSKGGSDGCGLS